MAEAEKSTPESISSISLERNAKGITQIKVKIYDEDPYDAVHQTKTIYDKLCEEYPWDKIK